MTPERFAEIEHVINVRKEIRRIDLDTIYISELLDHVKQQDKRIKDITETAREMLVICKRDASCSVEPMTGAINRNKRWESIIEGPAE